jgi:RES domain-containing protein
MTPHPERDALSRRLAERIEELTGSFAGEVFRFLNPKRAMTAELFAGKGSLWANGRWLLKGSTLCTYTSLTPETALAEALAAARYYRLPLSQATPCVMVSADVKLSRVVDLRNGQIRQRLRIAEHTILETNWRRENQKGREAITQAWGEAFQSQGIEGIIAPSAAQPEGTNLIVFPFNLLAGSRMQVVNEVTWPQP